MFETIERGETAVDACARALREAILVGALEPGERLPPERRLAENFGVNRITLRAALAKLSAANLLQVRQGSGYRVADYRAEGGPELIAGLVELAEDERQRRAVLGDLLDVRRQLARAVFDRLPPADPSRLDRVEQTVDAMAEVVAADAGLPAVVEADLAVVAALVAATDSAVLQLCLNPIQRTLRELQPLQRAMFRAPDENVAAWRLVLTRLRGPALAPAEIDQLITLLAERDQQTLDNL